jgi:hypothetical protein
LGRAALPWVFSVLGFAVAYGLVTWPLARQFGRATWGGPGDGWALIWQTHERFEHGISYLSPTYVQDVAWPLGTSLASAVMLSNSIIELPNLLLLALGFDDVAAYNLITFLASLVSSLVMAIVVRRLGCRPSVAFWAGLVYLLAPWHLEKIAIHPTLALMASLPLLLLGIVEWARAPSFRAGAIVVGAAALAVYTHAYYGIAAGLVLLAALPIVLVIARRKGRLAATGIATTALAGALAVVPMPLGVALAKQSSLVTGLAEHPLYLNELALRPHLLVLPSIDNPVFGDLSRRYLGDRGLPVNEGELALYVGVLTIALAMVGIGFAIRESTLIVPIVVAGVFAFVGIVLAAPAIVDLPLLGPTRFPASYVNELFEFVSAPARFFALTLTGMVVLAALGLELLVQRLPRKWPAVVIVGACVVSAIELPFHRDGILHDTKPTPLVRAMLETIPPGEPVAQYPSIDASLKPIADQLFYQLQHGHPVLNGGQPGTPGAALRGLVSDHLDPDTPGRLARLGYRWVTYDQPQAVEAQELVGPSQSPNQPARLPRGYRIVRRIRDGSVIMRVVARPARLQLVRLDGFYEDGWMGTSRGSLLACTERPGFHIARFSAGAFYRQRRVRVGPRELTVPPGGPQQTGAVLRLRRGCQLVTVELLGPPADRVSDVLKGSLDSRKVSISLFPERLDYVTVR